MLKSFSKFLSLVVGQPTGKRQVFHPSKICPECGSKLFREIAAQNTESADDWRCPNPDCPAQIRARLGHWCSREAMDIAGGDQALVAQLVGSGLVRDVAELYRLKLKEIAPLDGMDKRTAENFLGQLAASKKREAGRVLYGLAIPHLGAEASKLLGQHFPTLDHILGANAGQLLAAGNVSDTAAQSIVHWYGDAVNRRLIERLRKAGVNFKS